jgi:hypothetical protein
MLDFIILFVHDGSDSLCSCIILHRLLRPRRGLGSCILGRLHLFAKKQNVDELETVHERYYVLIAGHDAKYTTKISSDRGDTHR